MPFPDDEATAKCPWCGAFCAFGSLIDQNLRSRSADNMVHRVRVSVCRSCWFPLIAHTTFDRRNPVAVQAERIYPESPTRDLAPPLVRESNADLAHDFDEAVACEPHSKQAAVVLLARCANQILVEHCNAKKQECLYDQVQSAIAAKKVSVPLHDLLDGAHNPRNQVGHVWYDADGDLVRVTEDDAVWWFEIVEQMFDEFYIEPKKRAERADRVAGMRLAKKQGDKT